VSQAIVAASVKLMFGAYVVLGIDVMPVVLMVIASVAELPITRWIAFEPIVPNTKSVLPDKKYAYPAALIEPVPV